MSSFVQLFFSYEGRIRRRDFWLCLLGIMIAHSILARVVVAMFWPFASVWVMWPDDFHAGFSARFWEPWMQAWPALSLLNLVFLWSWFAVWVKRCHDRDKSGFWVLLGFFPIIGWAWAVIEFGLLDGTPGPNRYGPSPKPTGATPAPLAA